MPEQKRLMPVDEFRRMVNVQLSEEVKRLSPAAARASPKRLEVMFETVFMDFLGLARDSMGLNDAEMRRMRELDVQQVRSIRLKSLVDNLGSNGAVVASIREDPKPVRDFLTTLIGNMGGLGEAEIKFNFPLPGLEVNPPKKGDYLRFFGETLGLLNAGKIEETFGGSVRDGLYTTFLIDHNVWFQTVSNLLGEARFGDYFGRYLFTLSSLNEAERRIQKSK